VQALINILHLRDSPWVDGPGRTIIETGVRIDASKFGYHIGAFCGKNGGNITFIDLAKQRNLKVYPIRESGSIDPKVFQAITKIIEEENIDIIHTHEIRSDMVGLICSAYKHIPVIATLHGWIANNVKGRLYTSIDKHILRYFDAIIAVSEKMKREVSALGINKDKIYVLHNALVLENYKKDNSQGQFRTELGITDDDMLVANIGRLSPEKGQEDFIYAANEVLKETRNIRFVLIGIGPDRNKLIKLVNDLGLQKHVTFAGYKENMSQLYGCVDLIVQSSYTEGLPNVMLEAMAMGVPVIATNVGGTSEIIENGQNGILVLPGKPHAIAKHIMCYRRNPEDYINMAKNGIDIIHKYFDISMRTKKLEVIYETIMDMQADR
jgi:glycosyltransferase involved in cell wall biosynthesis